MINLQKFTLAALFSLAITLLNFQTGFAYPKPVALITNYEEVATGIAIQRANGKPSGSDALLYPGDAITGNVGYITIKFAPYADFHARNGAYIISYNPPSEIVQVANNVIDYATSFWNNVESVNTGASRGSDDKLNLNPQPGFDVTLLPNQTVHFAWEKSSTGKFNIKTENGKKIFEKSINGKNELDIKLGSIKLKPDTKYIWNVDGDSHEYKFSVLDNNTEKKIIGKLAEIDTENVSSEEKILKKATYLQLISDLYPEKVDLYWLSVQLLSEIFPTEESLKESKSVMLRKYSRHLDEEM